MSDITILIPTTPERRARLTKCTAAIHTTCEGMEYSIMTYENTVGWVKAVRYMLNQLDRDQLVIILNDDCVPQGDWLHILLRKYSQLFSREGDGGLLQPNDGIMNGTVATMPMGRVGYLRKRIHEGYLSYYADTELTERAKAEDLYYYVPEAIIHHEHHTNGKAEKDKTYFSQEKNLEHDKYLFMNRQREGFKYE